MAILAYVDDQERYQFSNLLHDEWLGVAPGSALGKPAREVLGEHGYAAVRDRIRRALQGERQEYESEMEQGYGEFLDRVCRTGEPFSMREARAELRSSDGSAHEIFLDFVYQPMRGTDGRVEGVLVFGFDVTQKVLARRLAEESARRLALLARVSRALAEARLELGATFDAIVGPLAEETGDGVVLHMVAPGGRLELVECRFRRASDGEYRWMIARAVPIERYTWNSRARRAGSGRGRALAPQLAAAGCSLAIDALREVTGEWDRHRLDQAITNLLGNAIKYGEGKPIAVTIGGTDEHARLEVRDQGIGIPLADQQRVFERFERAVSDRHYGGLGLGLWIARQAVEAHRGTIRLESKPGEGTTFIVELPRRRPA